MSGNTPTRRLLSRNSNIKRYNALSESDTDASPNPFVQEQATGRKKKRWKSSGRNSDIHGGIELRKRKPSLLLPTLSALAKLSEDERKLFDAVETGDVDKVREMLLSSELEEFDINKTNRLGYTILHIAVHIQNVDMVKFLLQQEGIFLFDTILHAIREEHVEITQLLLEFHDAAIPIPSTTTTPATPVPSTSAAARAQLQSQQQQQSKTCLPGTGTPSANKTAPSRAVPVSPKSPILTSISLDFRSSNKPKAHASKRLAEFYSPDELVGSTEVAYFDSEFNSVITPLMLAAQIGSVPLMEIFYGRGERLENEKDDGNHGHKCKCHICEILIGESDMTRVHQRYHLFKAITSPKYICFVCRKERLDPINYAIDKIIKLRKIVEKVTVNERHYEEFLVQLETFIEDMLDLCRTSEEVEIFFSPKETIGNEHVHIPNEYPRLWYTVGLDLRKLVAHHNSQNIVYKMWLGDWPHWDGFNLVTRLAIVLARCSPLFILWSLIRWISPKSRTGKMLGAPIGRFLDYIGAYIVFLMVLSFQVLFPYQRCNENPPYFQVDDLHCKQRGPPRIGTEWFLVLYIAGCVVSLIRKQQILWYWRMKWNWFELVTLLCFVATFLCWGYAYLWTQVPTHLQLIWSTERLMWPHNCAEILGECFLAMSTVLACARLLQFTQVFSSIGPIQIGLGRQITDFLSTGLIYVVVLLAFATGLLGLYVPYHGFTGLNKDGKPAKQDNTFTELSPTMQNLFWYLYGQASKDPTKLVSWEVEDPVTGSQTIVHHSLTEITGLVLYFLYHVIGSMMLFTMLSGYFAQMLSFVMGDIDTHWKYNRTELYLTFIKDTWVPPPLNLIPSLPNLCDVLCGEYCQEDGKRVRCTCRTCCYVVGGVREDHWRRQNKHYRKLIVELMFRYNGFKDVVENPVGITADDKTKEKQRKEILEFLGRGEATTAAESNASFKDDPSNHQPPGGPGSASGNGSSFPGPGPSSSGASGASPSHHRNDDTKGSKSTGSIPGTSRTGLSSPGGGEGKEGGGSKSATTVAHSESAAKSAVPPPPPPPSPSKAPWVLPWKSEQNQGQGKSSQSNVTWAKENQVQTFQVTTGELVFPPNWFVGPGTDVNLNRNNINDSCVGDIALIDYTPNTETTQYPG